MLIAQWIPNIKYGVILPLNIPQIQYISMALNELQWVEKSFGPRANKNFFVEQLSLCVCCRNFRLYRRAKLFRFIV